MQSLTTHWQLADDLCALSFPWVFHTLHCACLAWPTRIRFATKFFVPLAACTMRHLPFSYCQLPIANWNRNGKHGRKCLSIDRPSHSRCQNRCQIDAWFRCHTRCQGSSITAFALGRDIRDCKSPARCQASEQLVRPSVARNPKLASLYDFDLDSDLDFQRYRLQLKEFSQAFERYFSKKGRGIKGSN